jgi:hypothetical protein
MKEDILEQIGHDWLQQQNGKYVKTNLKYKPDINNKAHEYNKSKDRIHSDIDILSIDLNDIETVTVINCKSWMDGFDFKLFHKNLSLIENHKKNFGGKEYWKHFRDLISPKWHSAFIERIKLENPKFKKLKYIILNVYSKNKDWVVEWENIETIKNNFQTTGIELVSIESKEIIDLIKQIETKCSDFAENSDFTRVLQLLRVAKTIKE